MPGCLIKAELARPVMSATVDSSCGELSGALQRNAEHEARLSNVSDSCLVRTQK
jgi:hypothetical protein